MTAAIENQSSKIAVFGSGSLADQLYDSIQERGAVVACLDNDQSKYASNWNGVPIANPESLESLVYDQLIVASSYTDEILGQLAENNHLDNRVFLPDSSGGIEKVPALSRLTQLDSFDSQLVCKYLDKRKASNRYLSILEARNRVTDIQTLPSELVIDPTNLCNLRCPLCPTGRRAPGLAKGQLSVDDFRRIIEKMRNSLCVVWLQNWGEPTLHKELGELVEIADRNSVLTYLASNLNRLDDRTEDAILNRGLKFLKVEVDGASEESYRKFREGGELKRVLENMNRLAERKRSLGLAYPTIAAACLVSRYNELELDELKRLAIENGAEKVEFFRITLDGRKRELIEEWSPDRPDYPLDINDPSERHFCSDPWKMISVNFQGEAQPCCRIYDDRVTYGNLLEADLTRLWNNDYFASSRTVLASGGRQSGSRKTICHLCMGNLNSDRLEQVEGTLAIRLPKDVDPEYV